MGSIKFDFPPEYEKIQLKNVVPGTMITTIVQSGLFMIIQNPMVMKSEGIVTVCSVESGLIFDLPGNAPCTIWAGNMDIYTPENVEDYIV